MWCDILLSLLLRFLFSYWLKQFNYDELWCVLFVHLPVCAICNMLMFVDLGSMSWSFSSKLEDFWTFFFQNLFCPPPYLLQEFHFHIHYRAWYYTEVIVIFFVFLSVYLNFKSITNFSSSLISFSSVTNKLFNSERCSFKEFYFLILEVSGLVLYL